MQTNKFDEALQLEEHKISHDVQTSQNNLKQAIKHSTSTSSSTYRKKVYESTDPELSPRKP